MQVRLKVISVVFGLGLWGCATVPIENSVGLPPAPDTILSDVQLQELAGGWDYEEGSVVYQLTFDKEGKGTYEWEGGQFITTSLTNGKWKGTWDQDGNDREGEFELQLQPDLQTATGRWWYTRIGEDQDPLEPGGNFTLRRGAPGLKDQ